MTLDAQNLHLRRAGVLLHPTSLPSGVLDADVERWLEMLAATGFTVWQVLPLGEPHHGLSPYQCTSAFAMNPVFLPQVPPVEEADSGFTEFCDRHSFWLDDYTLFKVLKQRFDDASWCDWPDEWKSRDPLSLKTAHQAYAAELDILKWQQYLLHKRWSEIKNKAIDLGIMLFGDMPIFVAYDSADVWAHPEWFLLGSDGEMKVVTGVPPDYFSETGQRWGNPHYDWDAMQHAGYSWWRQRIHHHLEQFDLVRIDHFRGLEAAWEIEASCETAVDGHWEKIPGDKMLEMVKQSTENELKQLPFVAEDLGIITPEVTALRKKFQLPGMSIMQFGFDEFDDNPHKTHNIEEDRVVYTGTHDNDTTKGWFNSLDEHVKNHVLQVLDLLNDDPDLDEANDKHSCWHDIEDLADRVVEKMVDTAIESKARICMIPIQDCLHLGSQARMNTPGTIVGNWRWQFRWDQRDPQHDAVRLKKMRLRLKKAHRLVE